MFRPSDIIIEAFVRRLRDDYDAIFGAGQPGHRETIVETARMTLPRIARSNALFHDLDHTMLVTLVGQDILRGRMARDGDVSAGDWVHFVASLLCFAVGFVRNTCPGDDGDDCVIDEDGARLRLPRGATDARLWPHFADRGKMFVRHYFQDHPLLDSEVMAANIEYSRYPPPPDRNLETESYPGLLRAAHLIGSIADPNFMLKIKPLVLELEESGMTAQLGFANVEEFLIGYPNMFWTQLYPRVADGMELLKFSGEGRAWLANLHAHLLRQEHRAELG